MTLEKLNLSAIGPVSGSTVDNSLETDVVRMRAGLFKLLEHLGQSEIERISVFQPTQTERLPEIIAEKYSLMKYGDPEATDYFAELVFQQLISSQSLLDSLEKTKRLVIAPGGGKIVPHAADYLATMITEKFIAHGYQVDVVHFHKTTKASEKNYENMTEAERSQINRGYCLSAEDTQKATEATVVVLDDARATGSVENSCLEAFSEIKTDQIFCAYGVQFAPDLVKSESASAYEKSINHAKIKTLDDLLPLFQNPEVLLNARSIGFVLSDEHDPKKLLDFLQVVPDIVLAKMGKMVMADADFYRQARSWGVFFSVLDGRGIPTHRDA